MQQYQQQLAIPDMPHNFDIPITAFDQQPMQILDTSMTLGFPANSDRNVLDAQNMQYPLLDSQTSSAIQNMQANQAIDTSNQLPLQLNHSVFGGVHNSQLSPHINYESSQAINHMDIDDPRTLRSNVPDAYNTNSSKLVQNNNNIPEAKFTGDSAPSQMSIMMPGVENTSNLVTRPSDENIFIGFQNSIAPIAKSLSEQSSTAAQPTPNSGFVIEDGFNVLDDDLQDWVMPHSLNRLADFAFNTDDTQPVKPVDQGNLESNGLEEPRDIAQSLDIEPKITPSSSQAEFTIFESSTEQLENTRIQNRPSSHRSSSFEIIAPDSAGATIESISDGESCLPTYQPTNSSISSPMTRERRLGPDAATHDPSRTRSRVSGRIKSMCMPSLTTLAPKRPVMDNNIDLLLATASQLPELLTKTSIFDKVLNLAHNRRIFLPRTEILLDLLETFAVTGVQFLNSSAIQAITMYGHCHDTEDYTRIDNLCRGLWLWVEVAREESKQWKVFAAAWKQAVGETVGKVSGRIPQGAVLRVATKKIMESGQEGVWVGMPGGMLRKDRCGNIAWKATDTGLDGVIECSKV